jgi:hypothetical protein
MDLLQHVPAAKATVASASSAGGGGGGGNTAIHGGGFTLDDAVEPGGGGARGKGGGYGKGGEKGLPERVRQLEVLAIAHERGIHALEDWCSYVAIVRSEPRKAKLLQIRDAWREEDDARRKAHKQALETNKEANMAEHKMGSQRALLHAAIFREMAEIAHSTAGLAQEIDQAIDAMAKMEANDADAQVFWLKAKHDTPKEDRPWVFQIMLAEGCNPAYRAHLNLIIQFINKELNLARQQSQDGPIVKDMSIKKGKGKGRGSKGDDVDMATHEKKRRR